MICFPVRIETHYPNTAQQDGDENIKRVSDEFVFAGDHISHVLIVLYLIELSIVQKDNVLLYCFFHQKDDVDLDKNGYTEGEINQKNFWRNL